MCPPLASTPTTAYTQSPRAGSYEDRVKVPMSHHPQRQLLHHRCQELIRRDERKVVSLSTIQWKEVRTEMPDSLSARIEFKFIEGSLMHRQGDREIGSNLSSWGSSQVQLALAIGKRPHAQWIPSGTPKNSRALGVSLSADLAAAWLQPPNLDPVEAWQPPRPREASQHFTQFREELSLKTNASGCTIATKFHFAHREPPGIERGDALRAEGIATAHFASDGVTLLQADSKTIYFRYGREVGIDHFRLGPESKPFSWS